MNTDSVALHTKFETDDMPEECSSELKAAIMKSINLVTTDSRSAIDDLMTCQNYSTLSRLLRVTAQVVRAVRRFKRVKSRNVDAPTTITSEELEEAEKLWITSAQKQLIGGKDVTSQRKRFGLFKDDKGLWRCGGRLTNVDVPYSIKHPILLSRAHPLTTLIVREAHERVFHNGVKETLTESRRRFWIPKGRSLTRHIVHCCVLCRRFEGMPFQGPPPPPLPNFRVREDPAFTYTGVDFAGPLSVRVSGTSTASKVWICLFTCFVTRAVHLDAVLDQSTQDV